MNTMENKVTSVENKVLKIEESLEKKVRENIEEALENMNKEIEGLKKQMPNGHEEPKRVFMSSLAKIKLLSFDGKTSRQVYKTQFTMVAEVNGWNPRVQAFHMAASLRGEAADILETLPQEQRHDFQALSSALELRYLAGQIGPQVFYEKGRGSRDITSIPFETISCLALSYWNFHFSYPKSG
ncbi:gag-Pol polyprotein [Nephila pilipes]|uniref:Gag-Pol polyprotein n=1 Tax=Nephila pilipes TaxID=299642 RepID=A0A8X6IEK4_NEPPI|nr:gag-Pol polyprotein [Nephila pilipes]